MGIHNTLYTYKNDHNVYILIYRAFFNNNLFHYQYCNRYIVRDVNTLYIFKKIIKINDINCQI